MSQPDETAPSICATDELSFKKKKTMNCLAVAAFLSLRYKDKVCRHNEILMGYRVLNQLERSWQSSWRSSRERTDVAPVINNNNLWHVTGLKRMNKASHYTFPLQRKHSVFMWACELGNRWTVPQRHILQIAASQKGWIWRCCCPSFKGQSQEHHNAVCLITVIWNPWCDKCRKTVGRNHHNLSSCSIC